MFVTLLSNGDRTGWSFLGSVSDSDGKQLKLIEIDRKVQHGGNIEEYVAIELSVEYLQNHVEKGIDIKIRGKRSILVVQLPKDYVVGFLLKHNEARENYQQK